METVLVNNFSAKDAHALIESLRNTGISAYTKESGVGNISKIKSGHSSEDNHVVIIDQADEIIALKVLNEYRRDFTTKQRQQEMTCPKCGNSEPVVIYRELNFWERIIYLGTRPKVCIACEHRWY